MEKGTLIIFSTKKGFAAKISFTKTDGKVSELPVLSYQPKDDKYNNTACTFKRESGRLVQLIAHDGTDLMGQRLTAAPVAGGGQYSSSALGRQQHAESVSDSFSPDDARLPKDTREALATLQSPDNFALKLNKAARYDKRMGKFQFFKRERKGENYEIRANYGAINFKQLAYRELANAERLISKSNIRSFDLAIDWRMVQGLGIESVYETSLTLHHVYGIPYLPASTLKGVVRSWIIAEAFGQSEGHAIKDEQFCNLFGCPVELVLDDPDDKNKKGEAKKNKAKYPSFFKEARQGKITFFDTFPIEAPKIEVDVMNPHYGPYYSDNNAKTPPADFHNPIPVHFITVANTSFRFIIGASEGKWLNETVGSKPITEWLRDALISHGIGAKTAVGYGYMKPE